MKWYAYTILSVTVLSIAGLIIIFLNADPYESGAGSKYLFFTSLFLVLWGSSTVALNKFKLKIDWPDFYSSFRTGLMISLIGCLIIFLVRYVKY